MQTKQSPRPGSGAFLLVLHQMTAGSASHARLGRNRRDSARLAGVRFLEMAGYPAPVAVLRQHDAESSPALDALVAALDQALTRATAMHAGNEVREIQAQARAAGAEIQCRLLSAGAA